jgi:DNA-binding transcriptional ArsR family regulator
MDSRVSARLLPRWSGLGGEELASLAEIFKTLSDPTRLKLLVLLGEGEACVHELCAQLGMSQPAVSHQLRLLRVARLVRARRAGREVFYALDDRHVIELVTQARSHAGHARAGRRP